MDKDYKHNLLNEFERGMANIKYKCNCINCDGGRFFVECQLEKSVSLSKKSIPVQQLIKSGDVDKKYLKDYQFYINNDYVIVLESGIERFYKINKEISECRENELNRIRNSIRNKINNRNR
jgi:hypothetical protein